VEEQGREISAPGGAQGLERKLESVRNIGRREALTEAASNGAAQLMHRV
jgi:hypothetical protein